MKKILILLLLLVTGCTSSYEKVTIVQTKDMLKNNEIKIIIDVRTKEEYDMGHIENAINIPYDQIEDNLDVLDQYKNETILVYCRTSNRSTIAANVLHNNDFTKVYAMTDGYSNWK